SRSFEAVFGLFFNSFGPAINKGAPCCCSLRSGLVRSSFVHGGSRRRGRPCGIRDTLTVVPARARGAAVAATVSVRRRSNPPSLLSTSSVSHGGGGSHRTGLGYGLRRKLHLAVGHCRASPPRYDRHSSDHRARPQRRSTAGREEARPWRTTFHARRLRSFSARLTEATALDDDDGVGAGLWCHATATWTGRRSRREAARGIEHEARAPPGRRCCWPCSSCRRWPAP
uniref:Uncharacterized protein n=1 Tax=Aegilops tauschii subsp. strangulata TaxID=200361 RepID=A0A453BST4_AEGTS